MKLADVAALADSFVRFAAAAALTVNDVSFVRLPPERVTTAPVSPWAPLRNPATRH
jgi:hypothetical protein